MSPDGFETIRVAAHEGLCLGKLACEGLVALGQRMTIVAKLFEVEFLTALERLVGGRDPRPLLVPRAGELLGFAHGRVELVLHPRKPILELA